MLDVLSAKALDEIFPGSRPIDRQSQNMTVTARATADRKVLAHLSERLAIRLQSFSLPNMISIRLRRL
jgi:hypothetical protein